MDYLAELGSLAIASRLKRLSERISQNVKDIYKEQSVEFEPKWFPLFHLLQGQEKISVVDIAKLIGVTHQAVNQITQEMIEHKLITVVNDNSDKRKRLLSLSAKGKKTQAQLQEVWKLVKLSMDDVIEETNYDFLSAICSIEQALNGADLVKRYNENQKSIKDPVVIIEFRPELKNHFRRLNELWIKKYFSIEEKDIEIFDNAETIVKDGGMIFFAQIANKIVGTCALIKEKGPYFELAKMAVAEAHQGRGIGRKLLDVAVNYGHQHGAKYIILGASTKLASSVRLYQRAGFRPMPDDNLHKSEFARTEMMMQLDLSKQKRSTKVNYPNKRILAV